MTYQKRILCAALAVLLIFMQITLFSGFQPAELTDPIGDPSWQGIEPLHLGEGSQSEPTQIPTEPPETLPPETIPSEVTIETPNGNDNSEGQEQGDQGAEGGETAVPDLALVMTWYRYGSEERTIVCAPSETVRHSINTAQLVDDELKYSFLLTGEAKDSLTISSVGVKAGDGQFTSIRQSGGIAIELPDGSEREYTFRIVCMGGDGQEIVFTYVIRFFRGADLELELRWQKRDGSSASLLCSPNQTVNGTIKSRDLVEHVLPYTPALTGAAAEGASILRGSYTTASGDSGSLLPEGGALALRAGEAYDLTFEVEADGAVIFFHFTLTYTEAADVSLSFTWFERGITARTLLCQPDSLTSVDIRNNQLSAGAVKYEIALQGEDAENARILNISYTSATGGGRLEKSGAIPMAMPDGASENLYTVVVSVLAAGQQLRYEIAVRYIMDVSLEMTFPLADGAERTVSCENGKTKTAEAIYDDQLTDGLLSYRMELVGSAAEALAIHEVRCYQSGSGKTVRREATDSVTLLLENGKTGENTFTITALDDAGTEYHFTISIPYKHRGEKTVRITASLSDGQTVINGTETNLSVCAWTEDGAGNRTGYIPANGTDTKLIVTLDGDRIPYVSTSGNASEYILIPENPASGDTNEHLLHIYAEDAWGNYGELTITLRGQRNQSGQKTGTATIYVDMTVLGLGIVDRVSYEVLADEPISYSIAKAVFGMDLGDPYGAAKDTLGWKARYAGTLDEGFYLQSLTPGVTGRALEGSSWNQYGTSEEEILASIDAHFGKGTGLATLWRCIYRNGLNKSGGSGGTYGEFDYTSGSGWLFSLDGVYYPGLSMCQYSLEDGDVLTLRYTLAYGWDVGGGTSGYGNTAGYCVTALNGSYTIDHRMETVELEDGSLRYQCRCCGLIEACAHAHTVYQDLGDGSHVQFCEDCRTVLGDPQEHLWSQEELSHTCTACHTAEEHRWKEVEGSNTATCTEGGTRTVICSVCTMVRQEDTPAKGHSLNSRWNHTKTEHYQKCSVCLETIPESQGQHSYEYHAGDDDWYCTICDAGHGWDYCGNNGLSIASASCTRIVYHCGNCGLSLSKSGSFPEHHTYENGICTLCGAADPNYIPPTEPPETQPPITEPPETEPPTEPNQKNRRNKHESQDQ